MNIIEYKKGEIIFKQGDYAEAMFDILTGSVGIYTAYGTENEKQLTVLDPGQFLGEMGVIEAYPRSATAVALEDGTKLQEIGEKEFSDYFLDKPERLLEIMRQLSSRLRDRTADYQNAVRTLDEMKQTKGTPDKRSKSLTERIREMLAMYDQAMAAGAAEGLYIPCEGSPYPFYPF